MGHEGFGRGLISIVSLSTPSGRNGNVFKRKKFRFYSLSAHCLIVDLYTVYVSNVNLQLVENSRLS